MRRRLAFLAAALLAARTGAAQPASTADFVTRYRVLAAERGLSDSARLQRLFALDWENTNVEWPEFATYSGYPGQDDRWSDISSAAIARRRRQMLGRLEVLRVIRRDRLRDADQLSFDIFSRSVDEAVEGARFPSELLQVTQRDGPQYLSSTIGSMRAGSVQDYEHILRRLAAIPTVIDQTRALLDSGLALGITPPRVTLRGVPSQIEGLTPDDPLRSPLLEPFTRMPPEVPEAEQARLREAAVREYATRVRPAYRALEHYLVTRYIPGSRESLARSALPDGQAWYAFDVRQQTTLSRTPDELHALGLAEVARIRTARDSVIRATGFTGDFPAFVTSLHANPRFYFTDSASLVRGYRDIAKRIDPELQKLFGTLPRLQYGVSTVPAYAAPAQASAYYQQGSPAAHRAGQFFVNTFNLSSRPIWAMEALTAHEAVPGHHLQFALAQEMDAVPPFRRYSTGSTGFVEGWGLYAEGLGASLGLYRDPYSRYGQLSSEMWRAIRLVLDTGIHGKGWTRQQAIEYFKANSSKSDAEISSEVDRYIVWPGQALAYKSGELTFKSLRSHAEHELGARFDIRAFHDFVLGSGAMPLDILEARTRAWVAAQKGQPAR